MDTPRLYLFRITLVCSGAFLVYKGYKLSPNEIENLALTKWAPQILEAIGCALAGLGIFLHGKDN